jgi:hypothetical protein
MMSLTKNVKITRVSNAAAAAQTAIESSILDMHGYDGVLFLALLGDVSDGSVLGLAAEQNDANSGSGMAALAGAVSLPPAPRMPTTRCCCSMSTSRASSSCGRS